jgi:hypothetical protein
MQVVKREVEEEEEEGGREGEEEEEKDHRGLAWTLLSLKATPVVEKVEA